MKKIIEDIFYFRTHCTSLASRFNGKIKYIRDFFITLFFAALGMQVGKLVGSVFRWQRSSEVKQLY